MIAWIIFFICNVLFWFWIIRWGGAEWLEGTLTSGFLISIFAPKWSTNGIKLFAWLSLICSAIWFVAGIFVPSIRFI
jgi:hypothetical protein